MELLERRKLEEAGSPPQNVRSGNANRAGATMLDILRHKLLPVLAEVLLDAHL